MRQIKKKAEQQVTQPCRYVQENCQTNWQVIDCGATALSDKFTLHPMKMSVSLSPKFKVSKVENYDGSQDPIDHRKTFKAHIMLHDYTNEIACQTFP